MPRFYCPVALAFGDSLNLPAGAARHVQVLRMQPGDPLTLFNGGFDLDNATRGEFEATVTRMGRSDVEVKIGSHHTVEREALRQVHLVVGMPANERMDWLVEKATELGVASLQPLMTERSVLRLAGDRADKKQAHWQSVAIAACEQCGRNRVPLIQPVLSFAQWVKSGLKTHGFVLSLSESSRPLHQLINQIQNNPSNPPPGPSYASLSAVTFLSGPEGGLSETEEAAAVALGFVPASLGPRVLRAETAALAALAALTLTA
jgi:16S rRNA (uracil1498-N3)-methyltransferase